MTKITSLSSKAIFIYVVVDEKNTAMYVCRFHSFVQVLKVSYCKQIVRQRSCRKIFGQGRAGRGVVDHVKFFLSSSLIIMQNLVTVCHTVRAYVVG